MRRLTVLCLAVVACGGGRSSAAVEYASSAYGCPEQDVHILEAKENDKIAAYWLDICGTHRRMANLYDKERRGPKYYWKDVTPPLVRAFGSEQSRDEQEQQGRIDEKVDDLAGRKVTTLSYFEPEADIYVQVVADSKYPDSYSLRYASAVADPEFARFRSCQSFHAKADDVRWSSSRPDYDGQRRNGIMFELIGVGVRREQLESLARSKDARIRFCGTTFAFEPMQRSKLNQFLRRMPDTRAERRNAKSDTVASSDPPTQEREQMTLPKNVGVEPLEGLGVFEFRMSTSQAEAACEGSRVAKRSADKVHLLCPNAELAGTIDWDGAAAVFESGKLVEINFGWAAKSKAIANTEGVSLHGRVLRTLISRLGEPSSQKMECENGAQTKGKCTTLTEIETTWTGPNAVTLKLGKVSNGVFGIRLRAHAKP